MTSPLQYQSRYIYILKDYQAGEAEKSSDETANNFTHVVDSAEKNINHKMSKSVPRLIKTR